MLKVLRAVEDAQYHRRQQEQFQRTQLWCHFWKYQEMKSRMFDSEAFYKKKATMSFMGFMHFETLFKIKDWCEIKASNSFFLIKLPVQLLFRVIGQQESQKNPFNFHFYTCIQTLSSVLALITLIHCWSLYCDVGKRSTLNAALPLSSFALMLVIWGHFPNRQR